MLLLWDCLTFISSFPNFLRNIEIKTLSWKNAVLLKLAHVELSIFTRNILAKIFTLHMGITLHVLPFSRLTKRGERHGLILWDLLYLNFNFLFLCLFSPFNVLSFLHFYPWGLLMTERPLYKQPYVNEYNVKQLSCVTFKVSIT